jgi:hypothetical protein
MLVYPFRGDLHNLICSSGGKRCLEFALRRFLLTIGALLADDTEGRPWDRRKTPGTNDLFAIRADPKGPRIHAAKCASHVSEPAGRTLKIVHGGIAGASVLDSIQFVRARLDREGIPVSVAVCQLGFFVFKRPPEFVQFYFCHVRRFLSFACVFLK